MKPIIEESLETTILRNEIITLRDRKSSSVNLSSSLFDDLGLQIQILYRVETGAYVEVIRLKEGYRCCGRASQPEAGSGCSRGRHAVFAHQTGRHGKQIRSNSLPWRHTRLNHSSAGSDTKKIYNEGFYHL